MNGTENDGRVQPPGRFQMTLGRIPIAIMLITVLAAAVVVHLSWEHAYQRSVETLTRQLNTRTISGITDRVHMLLESADANLDTLHGLLRNDIGDVTDRTALERLFLTLLRANPAFSWITIGFPNGDFFGTQRQTADAFRAVNRVWDPEKKVARSENRFFQRGESTLLFTHSTVEDLAYYAPQRAWYRDAVRNGSKVWTDVYIYASSRRPGIDIAMPLKKNGHLTAVIAIGMELGQISDYLGGLKVGRTGTSFIIDQNSALIAFQDETEVVVTGEIGGKPQLGRLAAARSPLLQVAAEAVTALTGADINGERQWRLTASGSRLPVGYRGAGFLVTLAPSGHGDWLIGTVIPTAEVMAGVNRIQQQLLFSIGPAVALLGTVLFFLTRLFLVRPLQTITRQTARIGHCREQPALPGSPIVEIHHLAAAVTHMGRDLCAMRGRERDQARARLDQEQSFARLNQAMRRAADLDALCEAGLHFSVHTLGADIGALYLADTGHGLRLHAGHALPPDQRTTATITPADGWLGRAFLEKRRKVLETGADGAFFIHTGIGDVKPATLAALPLVHDDQAAGVMVIGLMRPITEEELAFGQRVANTIAVAVRGIQAATRNRALLRETVQHREALEANQEKLRETIEKLQRISDYKSEFLANMSHEIRTPMNAIIGMSHLALQTRLTPKQQNYLTKVHGAAHSLLGILNDILDFSKIEAGKMEMESVPFTLDAVLDNLATMLGIRAEEKGLELLFSRPREVPNDLIGDPMRLGQILINLCNNAIKFTDEGQIVVGCNHLETRDDRVMLKFSVQDSGIGMTGEQAGRIFQSFSQADSSTTRKYGGTGLGLSICKHLVERMEGEIGVTSEPGAGSLFTFTARFGTSPAADRRPFPLAEDFRGMRALVVDDNAGSRQVLAEILATFFFDCRSVASGPEALEAIGATTADPTVNPYDLVLIDWKMPDMDGIAVARQIKKNPDLQKPPRIVLITPFSRSEVIPGPDRLFLDGFAAKPVNPSQVFSTIMAVFDKQPATGRRTRKPAKGRDGHTLDQIMGARVLLVEDNQINQQVATELLESYGLRVTVAHNGREAVERVGRSPFDIVLMDIQMPEMDGLQATREIRKLPKRATLPIIAMTAHAMAGDREKSLAAGMDDHITKPIDPDRLFEALVCWIPIKKRGAPDPSHPAAKQSDPADLPERLPGIDLAAGLNRLAGNRKLFVKLLKEFYQDYRDIVPTLRDLLDRDGEEEALRLAHTFKGISGSLGAEALHGAARDLETAIRNGQPSARDGVLDHFEQVTTPLLRGLADLAGAAKPVAAPAMDDDPFDPDELTPLVRELLDRLAEGDPKSADELAEITPRLAASGQGPAVERLQRQVDDYEYDDAVETLSNLAGSLGLPLD